MYSFVFKNKPEQKYSQTGIKDKMLNDKNTTILHLKYRKGFLILVSGKGMEILYYFLLHPF